MKLISQEEVTKRRNAKIINEFKLAAALNAEFEKVPALNAPIQEMTKLAIAFIHRMHKLEGKTPAVLYAWQSTFYDERALKIWDMLRPGTKKELAEMGILVVEKEKKDKIVFDTTKQKDIIPIINVVMEGLAKYQHPTKKNADFPIKQCGELMRFFAGLVEKLQSTVMSAGSLSDKDVGKMVLYVGNKGEQVDLKSFCESREGYRNNDWGTFAFNPTRRTRDRADPEKLNAKVEPQKSVAAKDVLDLPDGETTGITLWKLKPGSVVRSFDVLLGLPEGADVSGTTSDTIFAVEALNNMIKGQKAAGSSDPNLLLFPMAAIVAGYHHTLLEVALSLAINDYISQLSVGFYSTMLPSQRSSTGASLYNILLAAENDPNNHHMLIFQESAGDKTWIEKAIVFDEPEERRQLKAALTLNPLKYEFFGSTYGSREFFTRNDIKNLLTVSGIDHKGLLK